MTIHTQIVVPTLATIFNFTNVEAVIFSFCLQMVRIHKRYQTLTHSVNTPLREIFEAAMHQHMSLFLYRMCLAVTTHFCFREMNYCQS